VGRGATQYQRFGVAPPRTHSGRVVDDLGQAIVSGKQKQGSLLPGDAELIARYGVSRTVVRESLKTLAAKGLVQAKARIGTRVRDRAQWNLFDPDVLVWHARTGFSASFVQHLGEMRMMLEPEAAALAALRRTAGEVERMYAWVDKMAQARGMRQEFANADLGFHLTIAEAAGNPFFLSISTLIEVALVTMFAESSPVDDVDGPAQSAAQHRRIAEAIEEGDPDKARRSMQIVVQQGIERLRP
jgi:DNA-binding FadR family transcriptional regulator